MESLKRSKDYDNVSENIQLNSYFQVGRIHGIKYLSSHRKFDKIFWGLAIVISLIFLLYFLFIPQNQSTITEISEKIPLYRVPFPAVTICPETKAKKSFVNITDAYHNIVYNLSEYQYDDEYLSYIEALTQVCDAHLFSNVKLKDESPTQGEKFIDMLREISVPLSEMILFCKFRNEIIDCSDLFTEIITDDGICYTFNMMDNENLYRKSSHKTNFDKWDTEKGYSTSELDANPKPALPGTEYGFNVVLNVKSSDLDFLCKGPVQGFKVRLHSPDEHPEMMNGYFRVSLNKDVIVSMQPEMSIDEVNIESNCHTSATKHLEFFHGYSQKNCLSECLSNFVLDRCGCVKFSMIHKNETNICDQHNTSCIIQAMNSFYTTERLQIDHLCDCKPACANLDYNLKTSVSDFDHKRVIKAFKEDIEEEFPKSVMSRIQLYFTNDHLVHKTIKYKEKKEQTIAEKISQIGGLMAFFIGASVLSIIEILYFLLKNILLCL